MRKPCVLIVMSLIIGAVSVAKSDSMAVDFDGAGGIKNPEVSAILDKNAFLDASREVPVREYGIEPVSAENSGFAQSKKPRIFLRRQQNAFKERLFALAEREGNSNAVAIIANPESRVLFDSEKIFLTSAGFDTQLEIVDPGLAAEFKAGMTCDSRGKCRLITRIVKSCTGGYIGAICTLWDFIEIIEEICDSVETTTGNPTPANEEPGTHNCVTEGTC